MGSYLAMGKSSARGTESARWIAVGILIALFLVSLFCIRTFLIESSDSVATSKFVRGRVVTLLQDNTQRDDKTEGILRGSQEVIVEALSGPFKGKHYQTTNYLSALYNINAQEGTRVVLRFDPQGDGYTAFIYSYDRSALLFGMFSLFALFLVAIGRKKGAMALGGLLIALFSIVGILFPLLEYGFPAVATTVVVIFYITVFTFVLIDGINRKTVSAALGTLSGVLIAGVFASVSGALCHISGFQTTEAEELLLIGTDHGMKISGLFTAGILIAALGAVMDVAMSIASAVHELHEVNGSLKAKELFGSGMNIGRDAMGTMANTLILAFVGSSFTLLLLIYFYDISLTQLVSTDLIAREVIQGLSGSIGIVLTVPIVAALSAKIETSK